MSRDTKITVEVALPDLLGMIVDRGYEDYEGDAHGVVTVGDLVAGQVASIAVGNADLMREIRDQVKTRVRQVIDVAMSSPPAVGSALQSMIIAEAQAQLRPNADTYQGTATPLAQYIGSEVYKAIREPAMAAVAKIEAQVDDVVQAEIKRQLEQIALRGARAFTP